MLKKTTTVNNSTGNDRTNNAPIAAACAMVSRTAHASNAPKPVAVQSRITTVTTAFATRCATPSWITPAIAAMTTAMTALTACVRSVRCRDTMRPTSTATGSTSTRTANTTCSAGVGAPSM